MFVKGSIAALGALGIVGEILNRRALRARLPAGATAGAVVVLGHPSRRDGSPGLIQRRRVEAGVRAFRDHRAEVLVMSGGTVRNSAPEAATMVRLAVALGVDENVLRAESKSRNTWENTQESAGFVIDGAAVVIVSEPMHAARARRYWLARRPEDADRIFVGRCPARSWWLSTPSALYELMIGIRDRRRP